MEPILTRCGYRCDLCLAYKPNVDAHPENRQVLSDGWFKYFGFRIPSEAIECDGCMSENPKLIDQSCPVRPCAIERGLDNCGICGDFDCAKFMERQVIFEQIQAGAGFEIPDEDRRRFILPYENKARLREA